ncbi:MAG: MFS transporter, partial [Bacteroidota bacterium]
LAFKLVGIPGIILAIVLRFTVKEPVRGFYDSEESKQLKSPPFWDTIKFLFSKKTFTFVAFATGLHAFVGYANTAWMPSLMLRIHGGVELWVPDFLMQMGFFQALLTDGKLVLNIAVVGLLFAFAVGVGGGLGTFLGGYLSDRLSKKDERWYMWISVISILASFPFGYFVIFTSNIGLLVMAFFISNILFGMYLGPSIAVSHNLVPAHLRAMASAVLFFVLNIIGIGMGPLVTGILSDLFSDSFGVESVRYALAVSIIADIIAMYLFYKAANTYKTDLQKAKEDMTS